MKRFVIQFYNVLVHEYRFVLRDPGVMLILLGAIFIYSFLYSLAYGNQVLYKVPIAVVDNSQTPSSRELIRMFNASPNLDVKYSAQGLEQARAMFMNREVYGVILIPEHYEKDILTGKTAMISIYADASYILIYKQTLYGAVFPLLRKNVEIQEQRFMQGGASPVQAQALSNPVEYHSSFLFNRMAGYGTFVMPGVMLLIMQQTLLIGIGMIGGTWRERRLYGRLGPVLGQGERLGSVATVLGKATCYLSFYLLIALYIYLVHYKLFGYPLRGYFPDVALFLLPYFLSAIFLGITLSTLFTTREEPVLMLLFSSVPLLILSGITWPVEGIPQWMTFLGNAVPSNNGVPGFIRLQVMGASLREVFPNYWVLWGLSAVYFVTAVLGIRRVIALQSR